MPIPNKEIAKLLEGNITDAEKTLVKLYAKVYIETRLEMATIYEKYSVNGVLSRVEMTKYNRYNAMTKDLDKILRKYDIEITDTLKNLRDDQYAASFYQYAWAVENDAGVNLNWGVIPESQVKSALSSPFFDKALINYTVQERRWIREEVANALTKGSSLVDINKALKRALNKSALWVNRIARTEMKRSQGIGQLDEYMMAQEKGVETRLKYMANLDLRTRDQSASMDGQISRPDGKFRYPDGNYYFIHQSKAAYDINDRCDSYQVVEGYDPELRRQRDKGVRPYITFKDWAKENGITKNKFGERYKF